MLRLGGVDIFHLGLEKVKLLFRCQTGLAIHARASE